MDTGTYRESRIRLWTGRRDQRDRVKHTKNRGDRCVDLTADGHDSGERGEHYYNNKNSVGKDTSGARPRSENGKLR